MSRLLLIKIAHTLIWAFFNLVIFYSLYAVIVNRIDKWFWISLCLIGLEVIVLLMFRMMCPLTIMARKYSDSAKDNFDIFLPNWLARNNKIIYGAIVTLVLLILVFRLVTG